MRNFDFFGAPLAGIVSMHRDLGNADALSVGMYLQTLMLVLTGPDMGSAPAWRSQSRGILTSFEWSLIYHRSRQYMRPGHRVSRHGVPGQQVAHRARPVEKHVVFLDR